MSDDLFDGPGSTTGIQWEDINGRLLLVKAESVETGIKTAYGDTDAVRADVIVLDGPGAPEEYRDTLIFPRVLQGQVRSNAGTGRYNLGRLGQGNKKPGQSPPWILADPTDADKAIARDYITKNQTAPF